MPKCNYRYYNFKPQELLTPDFLKLVNDHAVPLRIRDNKTDNEKVRIVNQSTMLFNFYISDLVDIQSLLKMIIILTEAKDIKHINKGGFNPYDVSIDSILKSSESTYFTYLVTTDKVLEGDFYIKITPRINGFTKISIKPKPFQLVLAKKMIHYFGGNIEFSFHRNKTPSAKYDGYTGAKFSQQGRWKSNFAIKEPMHFIKLQKEIFFKNIVPISNLDVIKMYEARKNNDDFTDENIKFVREQAEKEEIIEKKLLIDKNMNRKKDKITQDEFELTLNEKI